MKRRALTLVGIYSFTLTVLCSSFIALNWLIYNFGMTKKGFFKISNKNSFKGRNKLFDCMIHYLNNVFSRSKEKFYRQNFIG